MKDKVERLAKGLFEYEQPELLLSEETLSVSVVAGGVFCGKFSVYNRARRTMKGVLYSSDELLVLQETGFIGAENEITYTVHGEYAEAGELHEGVITIVSECGEITLPFSIQVMPLSCHSSEGEIRDLFQFASLAQSDWFEAKRLFASGEFFKTVLADRPKEQTLYRQLVQGPSLDHAMEEFLVYGRKKAPVQLRVDRTTLSFEPGSRAVMERLILTKDTWGYMDVSVETQGDFFLVSAKNIFSENFNGNCYILEVAVDGAALAEGKHFGRILLRTPRQCIPVTVTCICEHTARAEERKRHAFHVAEGKLFERYFEFRLGKRKAGSYLAEAESIVELLLVKLQERLFPERLQRKKELTYRMYRTYFALIGGKERLAESELEFLRAEVSGTADAELMGALQYLEAMRQKSAEQVKGYAEQIRLLSEQQSESGILLWFRLYTEKRGEGGRASGLAELAKRFQHGNRSPLLYYETALLWNEEPALLKELGGFELQALCFALRRGVLQKEAVLQFSILATQTGRYEGLLCRCLCLAYEQYRQRDTLLALCTLLIAGKERRTKFHRYFAEGCAAQLRLPGLQEYYIYSCGCEPQLKLDQSVLLYFIYGNELEEPYCAYLYAYVVRNKDSLSSFYRTYLKRIEQYAVDSIKNGRIDQNLAVIYAEVLRNSLLDAELAVKLPALLFSYSVECRNCEMTAVAVLHKEEEQECIVPLTEGRALVQLYTEEAGVVLLDKEGNRYLPMEDCFLQRLLHGEELLPVCMELAGENRMLLLNLLEKVHNYRAVDVDSVELSKRVVRLEGLQERFRQEELEALVQYCYDNFQGELMDSYLARLNLDFLNKEERSRMIELLIVRGRYDLALDALAKYGMRGVAAKRILRLCSHMLLQCGEEQNDMLLVLCRCVFFSGICNEAVVQYLVRHFYGTTEEMYQLWQAAAGYELQTAVLEERLLGQILFTENYIPEMHRVFLSYVGQRYNQKLVQAYVSCMAYRYFLRDCEIPEEVFEWVCRAAEEENAICCLAVLKNDTRLPSLTEEQVKYAEHSMLRLAEQGKVFPFFEELEGKVPLPPCMSDKIYVEYHTNPNRKVRISYLYDNDGEDAFRKEEMRHIGYGVFVKEFILFYGEVLQYYITEEQENGQVITESFYRKIDAARVHDETTKYGQINLILTAQDMQDDKTTIEMLESYFRMEYTIHHLFAPRKE